jgi:hypothetical protein
MSVDKRLKLGVNPYRHLSDEELFAAIDAWRKDTTLIDMPKTEKNYAIRFLNECERRLRDCLATTTPPTEE